MTADEDELRLPFADGVYMAGPNITYAVIDGTTTNEGIDYIYKLGPFSLSDHTDRLRILCLCLLSNKNSLRLKLMIRKVELQKGYKRSGHNDESSDKEDEGEEYEDSEDKQVSKNKGRSDTRQSTVHFFVHCCIPLLDLSET